ncbi:hypothetical protein SAMN04487970_100856 [Paenibacillus tianmuensis]|uniref:Uncharacterized protein n=2 Tax=Paenibacillus tianmuensis TaxID=624147 RepID=A0A1G4QNZ7_9BACL|nr:hypothetical protein SAMN04487970_100856 [Paenibacillus tianmuensis]
MTFAVSETLIQASSFPRRQELIDQVGVYGSAMHLAKEGYKVSAWLAEMKRVDKIGGPK